MTKNSDCTPVVLLTVTTTKSTNHVLHILTVVSLSLAFFLSPVQARETNNSTAELPKSRSSWPHKGETTQVISSTSYIVGKDTNLVKKRTNDSTVVFHTKPVSLSTSLTTTTKSKVASKQTDTYFVNNECFGPNCPPNKDLSPSNQSQDEGWESYYGTLNKGVDPKYWKKKQPTHQGKNIVSFTVQGKPSKSHQSTGKRQGHAISLTRRTQTTTTAPGWVKLQPVLPSAYDPFGLEKHGSKVEQKSPDEEKASTRVATSNHIPKPTLQINRIGEELSPETFATRWGWGSKNEQSRLPQWLVELNDSFHKAHANKHRFQDRYDDRKWVKLEPIPVAGVSISKWVPKGTATKDLPSTNWPTRDRPNAWWDRIDSQKNSYGSNSPSISTGNRIPFPVLSPTSSSNFDGGNSNSHSSNNYNKPIIHQSNGWSSTSSASKGPTNNWRDVIYPEGPTSATVSWLASNKGISRYPSSFTARPTSSSFGDIRKPATGSWTASRRHSSYPSVNRAQPNYRPSNQPSYLPLNSNTHQDDPRWVLISQTRPVVGFGSESNNRRSNGGHRYQEQELPSYLSSHLQHHDFDRNSDFPFKESLFDGHRGSKKLKKRKSKKIDHEEAFRRLNETLMSLRPVLDREQHKSGLQKLTEELRKHANRDDLNTSESGETEDEFEEQIQSSLKPFMNVRGTGRAVGRKRRFTGGGLSLNPVLAAVGAGMIPATMAAVLPVVMGRRKRDLIGMKNEEKFVKVPSDLMTWSNSILRIRR